MLLEYHSFQASVPLGPASRGGRRLQDLHYFMVTPAFASFLLDEARLGEATWGTPHGAPRKCGLVFCLACSSLLPPRSMSCEARYCLFFKHFFFRRPVTHSDSKFNCWLIRPILHSFGWTSLFNWMVWSRIKRHSLFSSSPCHRMPPQKLVPSKPSSFLASA